LALVAIVRRKLTFATAIALDIHRVIFEAESDNICMMGCWHKCPSVVFWVQDVAAIFMALGTQVVVLAGAALVTLTYDGISATSIANYVQVHLDY
jgi:hypothetical protein